MPHEVCRPPGRVVILHLEVLPRLVIHSEPDECLDITAHRAASSGLSIPAGIVTPCFEVEKQAALEMPDHHPRLGIILALAGGDDV